MGISRGSKALALGLLVVVLAAIAPARAAGRQFRIGIVEFRQFSVQEGCDTVDAATDAAASSGAPASSRLPQFALERFKRGDCVLVKFLADGGGATTPEGHAPTPDPAPSFALRFVGPGGALVHKADAALVDGATDLYAAYVNIGTDWPAGEYKVEAVPTSSGDTGVGRFRMTVNALGTRVLLSKPHYKPGDTITVNGVTWKDYQIGRIVRTIVSYPEDPTRADNVPATGTVTLKRADGKLVTKNFTASSDPQTKGEFSVTFSPAEYGNVAAGAADGFVRALTLRASATYEDQVTGPWVTVAGDPDSEALLQFQSTPDRPEVLAKFTSETGWVKPGEEFVHQLEFRNLSPRSALGAVMRYEISGAARFVSATPAPASVSGGAITWNLGTIKAGTEYGAANRILVTMRALSEAEDRTVLWKNLSAEASLSVGGAAPVVSTTHGPRVATLDTARYGDRPFPVVLIDYLDAAHSSARPGWYYEQLINQPKKPSSVLNLYQEMSFGQLFPHGTLASLSASDASFDAAESYRWSTPLTGPSGRGACLGATNVPPAADPGQTPPAIPSSTTFKPSGQRIVDGWYRLPGQQAYYGGDRLSFGQYAARLAGNAGLGIDNACGPTGKAAYDAASIADPDIDYNEFDTDRNGVVDFFMFISRGLGGNGASQTAGYDAIWPHSSDLQGTYIDPATGEQGYVSHDQLRDRLERPLWWKSADARKANTLSSLTTKNMGDALKAYVRVGPYNANPEVSTTSVIAHEYGHSLGLPDFYSTSNRETVDMWDLMSTDNSQFMSVFSRQDLGWLVPKVLTHGTVRTRLTESKIDTHTVEWFDSAGRPYTLSGPDVHNGDAYYVPMPETTPLSKAASGKYVYWSTRGDNFGCPGKTLDVPLHALKSAASGDTVKLTFNSWYDIEWDYDYGFVMVSEDGGKTFTSLESENGTTTPAEFNPNQVSCQNDGNGITGTSSSRDFPSNAQARAVDAAYPDPVFFADSYDLSSYAGKDVIIRFAYSTDPGVARMGWFIDDLKVTNTTTNVTYLSDDVEAPRMDYIKQGWTRFLAGGGVGTDRGYYLEMRDRIGFDYDGRGQSDRTAINWMPGVSLWWTDEFGGYGNTGQDTNTLPNQTPLDARAQNKVAVPELADAAFFDIPGLNKFTDKTWTDNYTDPSSEDGVWRFGHGCFSMTVEDIAGLGRPGATATVTLSASRAACRKGFGPATSVLGSRTSRKPAAPSKPRGDGGSLPATGLADGLLFGAFALAAAAGLARRIRIRES